MPYDEKLADRIRALVTDNPAVTERKMFGGIAFMFRGNMFVGIVREDLMARVGPDAYDEALALPHAKPMDFTGRPMKGMLYVSPPGIAGKGLQAWVDRTLAFVEKLPPK
jgi:TfoX/Sxy family transcriptional regulator of competence genes